MFSFNLAVEALEASFKPALTTTSISFMSFVGSGNCVSGYFLEHSFACNFSKPRYVP